MPDAAASGEAPSPTGGPEQRAVRRSSRVSFSGSDTQIVENAVKSALKLDDDEEDSASHEDSFVSSNRSIRSGSDSGHSGGGDGLSSRCSSSLGGGSRRSSLAMRRLSVRRNSSVDISKKMDTSSVLIDGRETHTADLAAYDKYVARLKTYERDQADGPFNPALWDFLRGVLEEHGQPIGFEPQDDPEAVVPKGPDDAMKFLTKKFFLDDFSPINPKVVSDKSKIPLGTVLNELLYSTRVGLTSIKFVPQCVRCGGAVCDVGKLGLVSGKIDCRGCLLENDVHSLDAIATVFFLHPSVMYVLADGFGCNPSKASMAATEMMAPIPATTTGSGFRYSIACGDKPMREEPLAKGLYRMHCLIASTDNYLEVLGDAPTANDKEDASIPNEIVLPFKISDYKITDPTQEREVIKVPHGRIHFDVKPDTGSLMALWIQKNVDDDVIYKLPKEERAPYTSAATIINHPSFNRMFATDETGILRVSKSLEITNVVLVFTDVVGSTRMYASLGDMQALELVEKHYEVLFSAFSRWGRVVKTVGDAVMASFATGRGAIEAVAAAIAEVGEACPRPDGVPFEVRVGIHAGSAVVTPLNGINDYFGQTVNIAARVEAKAGASSCLITDAVLSDPDAMVAYEEVMSEAVEFVAVPETEMELKGVTERVKARGFALADEFRHGGALY